MHVQFLVHRICFAMGNVVLASYQNILQGEAQEMPLKPKGSTSAFRLSCECKKTQVTLIHWN